VRIAVYCSAFGRAEAEALIGVVKLVDKHMFAFYTVTAQSFGDGRRVSNNQSDYEKETRTSRMNR
jgi:hypothetical protein